MPGDDMLDQRCRRLVAELGLAGDGAIRSVQALGGGVASDIAVVDLGHRQVCVKFALPRLRVAAEWLAPVHRNAAEYRWLAFAASVEPFAVPRLHGRSAAENGFAMEHIGGPEVRLWKSVLLAGRVPEGVAARVGAVLGRIHAASARPGFDAQGFANQADFHALRLEPYLLFTATRHPGLAPRLHALADACHRADRILVHGDVSPKNILLRGEAPVLLDAECATMGDPAFDLAFCLNHLVLKALHLPACRAALTDAARALRAAYLAEVDWEEPAGLEARAAALLPALMLARVDGKSPVEYLGAAEQDRVRALSVPLVATPAAGLAQVLAVVAGAA